MAVSISIHAPCTEPTSRGVVVALPTAAPKKVWQTPSRTSAADRKALLRFPDIRQTSRERSATKRREKAQELDIAGIALILRAIGQTMSKDQQRQTLISLVMSMTLSGGDAAHAFWDEFVVIPGFTLADLRKGGE